MCRGRDGSIDRRQFRARCCHHGSGELQFWPWGVLSSGDSGLLLRILFEVDPQIGQLLASPNLIEAQLKKAQRPLSEST